MTQTFKLVIAAVSSVFVSVLLSFLIMNRYLPNERVQEIETVASENRLLIQRLQEIDADLIELAQHVSETGELASSSISAAEERLGLLETDLYKTQVEIAGVKRETNKASQSQQEQIEEISLDLVRLSNNIHTLRNYVLDD